MNDTPLRTVAETMRMAFESAWMDGRRKTIEEAMNGVSASQHQATLEELVAIELEFRIRAGEAAALEDYLARFPTLADHDVMMRMACHEYWVRHRYGDQPSPASYAERFPDAFPSVAAAEKALGSPPAPQQKSTESAWTPGLSLGRYELLEKHAEGGFGEVWKARDTRLDRVVAIKRLSDRMAQVADGRRLFNFEVDVTSKLQHPGIVPVHDCVFPESGPPYYAMKYVAGRTYADAIQRWRSADRMDADQSMVELRRLLTHYVTLCQAVAFAHAHGIVHRDLKPDNVMLGDFGETIVLDWGLAKRIDDTNENAPALDEDHATDRAADCATEATGESLNHKTRHGSVLGTPGYMAPEQAEGRIADVRFRADVYSLGAILHEILHGSPPQPNDSATIPRLPAVVRPLQAIAQRATATLPEDRFESVGELVDEVERWLADEPLRCYPEPLPRRMLRFVKRHRTAAAGLVVAMLAGIVGSIVISSVVLRANRELRQSQQQTDEQRNVALANLKQATENLSFHRVLLAHDELQNNNVGRANELLDRCPPELRNWEWHFVKRRCRTGDPQALSTGSQSVLRCVEWSPSGQQLAALARDGTVYLWDAATGELIHSFEVGGTGRELRFAPDGRLIVGTTVDKKGVVTVWNVQGERLTEIPAHRYAIASIAISDDGQWLATGSADRTIGIWRIRDWKRMHTLKGHRAAVSALAFSADSKWLASGSMDQSVKLWDCASGDKLQDVLDFDAEVHAVAFHPNGDQLAVGGHQHAIQLATLELLEDRNEEGSTEPTSPPSARQPQFRLGKQLVGHSHFVRQLYYSTDGRLLVSASFDRTVRLWRMPSGEPSEVLRGHDSHLRWATISRDGSRVASASEDKTVRLWQIEPAWSKAPTPASMVAAADGGRLFAHATERNVTLLEQSTQRVLFQHKTSTRVYDMIFSPNDRLAVGLNGEAVVVDESGAATARVEVGSPVLALAFLQADGSDRLLTGSLDGRLVCWDTASGKSLWDHRAHPRGVAHVSVSPDGRWILSGGADGNAILWDANNQEKQLVMAHPTTVSRVAFHPTKQLFGTACYDGRVRIWDFDGQKLQEVVVGNQWVTCLSFSPDGKRLASGSEESLKLWDVDQWEEVLSLTGHQCIQEFVFTPDGTQLICSGNHLGLRTFDGAPLDGADARKSSSN